MIQFQPHLALLDSIITTFNLMRIWRKILSIHQQVCSLLCTKEGKTLNIQQKEKGRHTTIR